MVEKWIVPKGGVMQRKRRNNYRISEEEIRVIREASDYWDKHNIFEKGKPKEVQFDIDIKGSKRYVLLDNDVADEIGRVSKKKRQPIRVVVNNLLKKSLHQAA